MYLNHNITTLMLKQKYYEFKQHASIISWLNFERYAFNGIFEQQSQVIRHNGLIHKLIMIDFLGNCDIFNVDYIYYRHIIEQSLFAYWNNVTEIRIMLLS